MNIFSASRNLKNYSENSVTESIATKMKFWLKIKGKKLETPLLPNDSPASDVSKTHSLLPCNATRSPKVNAIKYAWRATLFLPRANEQIRKRLLRRCSIVSDRWAWMPRWNSTDTDRIHSTSKYEPSLTNYPRWSLRWPRGFPEADHRALQTDGRC